MPEAVSWPRVQVVEFQASTAAFLARLHEHGPGTLAANLPGGLEALRHHQEQMESMVKQRKQLALAEHLFDLGQTFYSELSKARFHRGLELSIPRSLFCAAVLRPCLTQACIHLAGGERTKAPGKRVQCVCLSYGLAAHVLGLPVE